MDASWLGDVAAFALPSGFLGAVVSWTVGRRKRNNDFLGEMQRSIDLLSEKYNAVLQDNVALRCEKAEWLVLQQDLARKVEQLTREVESLRRKLDPETPNHEKRSYPSNRRAAVVGAGRLADNIVRGIAQPDAPKRTAGADNRAVADDRTAAEPLHGAGGPALRRANHPA